MSAPVKERRLLKASEVAEMFGLGRDYVRFLVAAGKLESVRFGPNGWHRFRVEDVERLIAGKGGDAP